MREGTSGHDTGWFGSIWILLRVVLCTNCQWLANQSKICAILGADGYVHWKQNKAHPFVHVLAVSPAVSFLIFFVQVSSSLILKIWKFNHFYPENIQNLHFQHFDKIDLVFLNRPKFLTNRLRLLEIMEKENIPK